MEEFFTDEEVSEQVNIIKQQREERENKERSLHKGFTLICNNCGEKLKLSKWEENEGKINLGTKTEYSRVIEGDIEETKSVISCECGNSTTV